MTDDPFSAEDHARWGRHDERLGVPLRWWVGPAVGAVVLSEAVALWRDPTPRMLVGLPLLMLVVLAAMLGYSNWIRVVVENGVVTTKPRTFRFAVDAILGIEVVDGAALKQERVDHALTNRALAPPWISVAVVAVVELEDGQWTDYVVGTRRLEDLLKSLTLNRTDRRVPAETQVRSQPMAMSPSLYAVRQHNRQLKEQRRGS